MKPFQPHLDSEIVSSSSRSSSGWCSRAFGLLVVALAACAEQKAPSATASGAPETAPSGSPSSAPAAPGGTPSGATPSGAERTVQRNGLLWYEDAPDAAFAAARATGRRVVIDLWAPWCHTCLSMQNFVLSAQNLPTVADRVVWLAIDTEREENASLLERLPVSVWPTFYVVDPDGLAIRGRLLGAASPSQFARFVEEGDRSAELARHGAGSDADPLRALARADELAAGGHLAEAARAYGAALAAAPSDWPRRPETLVAQITALYKAKDFPECLSLGTHGAGLTGSSASAIDFAYYALECAAQTQPPTPQVAELRRTLVERLQPLCERGSSELSPDDQADACDKLSAAFSALGDAAAGRRATEARLAVLDRAAAGKPPEIALTYDWARTDALLQLGRAEEALAIATQRERELPENYNPPHYRAKAFKALGRWQEGLDAVERALSLAYGPRRIGLLTLKADLQFGAGRAADGASTLKQQLELYRALPAGQRQPAAEARVEQRLRELPPAAPGR